MQCEPCGADSWALVHADVFGMGANLMRCAACGFKTYDVVLQEPEEHYNSPAATAMSDNSERYGDMVNRDPERTQWFRDMKESFYLGMVAKLTLHCGGLPRSVYEVGTDWGAFLLACRKAGVPHVFGCDINRQSALNASRVLGVPIEAVSFQCARASSPHDAVAMLDVIEHTWTPRSDLEKAADLLRPGGVLLLKTFYDEFHERVSLDLSAENWMRTTQPDKLLDLDTRGYFCPHQHPCHFDWPVLVMLIERCGFTVIEAEDIKQYGQILLYAVKE